MGSPDSPPRGARPASRQWWMACSAAYAHSSRRPWRFATPNPSEYPDATRSNMISCLLEERERFATAPFQLVHLLLSDVQPRLCSDDFRERLSRPIA